MIFIILAIALLYNAGDSIRLKAISILLLVEWLTPMSADSEWLISLLGYYGHRSIEPLVSAMILLLVGGSISTSLILLFTLYNFFHLICFLTGAPYEFYNIIVWLFFMVEIAILFSRRITDALANYVHRFFDSIHMACFGGCSLHKNHQESNR